MKKAKCVTIVSKIRRIAGAVKALERKHGIDLNKIEERFLRARTPAAREAVLRESRTLYAAMPASAKRKKATLMRQWGEATKARIREGCG